jgi:hypothetical protein
VGVGGGGYGQPRAYVTLGEYQTPPLEPKDGFTIDKALVYAIVRQESAFNPDAYSHAGAYGLMQVLPASATLATGDKRYRQKPKTLLDPATNLRVGQDYIAYLMVRGVGGDLLRVGGGLQRRARRGAEDHQHGGRGRPAAADRVPAGAGDPRLRREGRGRLLDLQAHVRRADEDAGRAGRRGQADRRQPRPNLSAVPADPDGAAERRCHQRPAREGSLD